MILKISFLTVILSSLYFIVFAQVDHAGSGRAISFDGVNDYVEFGNIFDDLHLPLSVSAWIKVDPDKGSHSPIFVSQDNFSLYNGFWFIINPTHLFVGYGDGLGSNNPLFRREKSAPHQNVYGEWTHVCAVVKGPLDMDIYINGVNAGGIYTGFSDEPMASDFPGEVAKSGHWFTNNVAHRFKGLIDDIRIWDIALSENQVREQMCKKIPNDEVGLIAYWNFDETGGDLVFDNTANNYTGTLRNGAERKFSGAAIGDESVYYYGQKQVFNIDDLEVVNITGNPLGMHLYKVLTSPSQHNGLSASEIPSLYYGVFAVNPAEPTNFDIHGCGGFLRQDNSVPDWEKEGMTGIKDRTEVIHFPDDIPRFDLGENLVLCDASSYTIHSNVDPEGKTFLWNTGEDTPDVTVNKSGTYTLTVSNSCGLQKDSVELSFIDGVNDKSLPNIITPNSDSFNQYFLIEKETDYNMTLQIYNRWGKQVFGSNDYQNNWDASGLSGGVYFYQLRNACGEEIKGIIHVVD